MDPHNAGGCLQPESRTGERQGRERGRGTAQAARGLCRLVSSERVSSSEFRRSQEEDLQPFCQYASLTGGGRIEVSEPSLALEWGHGVADRSGPELGAIHPFVWLMLCVPNPGTWQ